MLEGAIEKRLIQEIKKIGGECYKWISPGYAGVPDRIILLPNGKIAFVELKAPGKKERRLQELRQERMRGMGFAVFSAVDSFERIEDVIKYLLTDR